MFEAAGVAHRAQQVAGLGGRAGAELDQRPRRAGGGDDLGRALGEDLALGARRVVLGQLGDLLEELRAALVVEVLRRQLLRRGGEAGADVVRHLGPPSARGGPRSRSARRRRAGFITRRPSRSGGRRRSGAAAAGPSCGSWAACTSRLGRPGAAPQHLVARRRRRPPSTRGRGTPRSPGRRGSPRSWSIPRPAPTRRARGAAASHSNSVGSRLPAQRAKASASSQETWMTGGPGRRGRGGPSPATPSRPRRRLPVHRRLGPRLLDEGDVGAVGHRGSVDLEGGELDRVAGPLVVVGEARTRRADLVLAGLERELVSGPSALDGARAE